MEHDFNENNSKELGLKGLRICCGLKTKMMGILAWNQRAVPRMTACKVTVVTILYIILSNRECILLSKAYKNVPSYKSWTSVFYCKSMENMCKNYTSKYGKKCCDNLCLI
jgi:hypothetical protein